MKKVFFFPNGTTSVELGGKNRGTECKRYKQQPKARKEKVKKVIGGLKTELRFHSNTISLNFVLRKSTNESYASHIERDTEKR